MNGHTANRAQRRAGAKGFRPKPKATAQLRFTDGDFEGAEVECSLDASVGYYLMLARPLSDDEVGRANQFAEKCQSFGDELLLSWNYEDRNGEPVPANGAGMKRAPVSFAQAIFDAWIDAKAGISPPLDESSNDTAPLPERSMKTVTPLPNQPS